MIEANDCCGLGKLGEEVMEAMANTAYNEMAQEI